MAVMGPEVFMEYLQPLVRCCLNYDAPTEEAVFLDGGGAVSETLFAEPSIPDEDSGLHVAKLDDGRFVVLIDSQDYTGHGCRCSSSLTIVNNERELWTIGLTQEWRDRLKSVSAIVKEPPIPIKRASKPIDPPHLAGLDEGKVKQ